MAREVKRDHGIMARFARIGGQNRRVQLLVRWTMVCGVITVATIAWTVATRFGGDAAVLPGERVEGLTSILDRDLGGRTAPVRFRDVTSAMGLDFRHFPAHRASLLPEDMGSGVACADYDDDGYPDLYFVNFAGSIVDGDRGGSRAGAVGRSRLFRNVEGTKFEDVTDRAGVGFAGYGMGAAWGDYDNDGDLDLYVTAFGSNVLYRNQGDGTFVDVTEQSGVADERFSAGSAWGDYDRDGDLDLYVTNYVAFVYRAGDRAAVGQQYATEQPYTLNPSSYRPQPNSLFRNNGDGTFQEVAAEAGVADPQGRGLSAVWVDFDNDGYPDLYVANDVSNNGVFRNLGDGTFEDVGAPSLAADYRGAMGLGVSDFDDDLDLDLLVTHWLAQENALFRNMTTEAAAQGETSGRLWFMDDADIHGFGQVSLDAVGWATGFADFDNDAHVDAWIINGSTLERDDGAGGRRLEAQQPFLFWNTGENGFVDIAGDSLCAGPDCLFNQPIVGRGGAAFDMDLDGLVDLAVNVNGGLGRLLHNESKTSGRWLRVHLRQTGGNTFAIGARCFVTIGDRTRVQAVTGGGSYLSQDESGNGVLHFGVGDAARIDNLRVVWPDGQEEVLRDVETNQSIRLTHQASYPVRR